MEAQLEGLFYTLAAVALLAILLIGVGFFIGIGLQLAGAT